MNLKLKQIGIKNIKNREVFKRVNVKKVFKIRRNMIYIAAFRFLKKKKINIVTSALPPLCKNFNPIHEQLTFGKFPNGHGYFVTAKVLVYPRERKF